jgi:redox-sensing transcriptional repressor
MVKPLTERINIAYIYYMNPAERIIPPSVVRRLTKYLAYLQELHTAQVAWVSSQDLAQALGLTSSTVRQDISHINFSGISKRGYETAGLMRVLSNLMGADRPWKMVVVGAGHLGQALTRHEDFQRRGFEICGLFDNDERKIGRRVGRLTVKGMRALPAAVGSDRVDIGVISVPASAAQSVADLLIASGIRGLLNLSLGHIIAPRHVAVIDSRIVASLLELTHAINVDGSSITDGVRGDAVSVSR